jgi:hypothetical protein
MNQESLGGCQVILKKSLSRTFPCRQVVFKSKLSRMLGCH